MDASHPDFNKLEIKVGCDLPGSREAVFLRTVSSSSDSWPQPRLLVNSIDRENFFKGKPVKFLAYLQVPYVPDDDRPALVYAEIDPANKIRETSDGERRVRTSRRFRSCAPRTQ